MSYTAKEVEEKIEAYQESGDYDGDYSGGIYCDLKDGGYYAEGKSIEVPGLGTLEYVEDYGGEGQGDDYWVVFKVGNQLFRKDGWYASYDGGELDGELYEVEAVQVQRTEYHKKK